jgi:outer membrane protein
LRLADAAAHEATLQATLLALVQAYFDAHTASAALLAKTQTEEIASQTLAITAKREAKGAGAQSDTLQAATAQAKAALEKNRAQGAYQKTLSILAYSMGLSESHQIILPALADQQPEPEQRNLNSWLDQAKQRHPAILAARAQVNAANNKVSATRAAGLPTVDLSINHYRNGRPSQSLTPVNSQETSINLVLNVPIFDGFSRNYQVRGALAHAEQKEAELAEAEQQIIMEVVKAHADASSSLQNLDASASLLTAASHALSAVQRKYDRGAADTLEMLNVQAALADAQQERIRCLAEWRGARLRLLASAGLLGRYALGK